ncbi:MAG: hypothetical protein MET45_04505 [Nostoc sp. LLA-1]|nr:hypothetical protein [Cyanocohniella sp. LLY]
MEAPTKKETLLKEIHERLEQAYEGTLEEVLELLNVSELEDEEDIKDAIIELEDAQINGTVTWEQY